MRLVGRRRRSGGDTIIEVIFAIAVFSFVAISSLMLMNKGVAAGERSLEITLVRQQISAQAEALRYIQEARVVTPGSAYGATWVDILNRFSQESASPYGVNGSECKLPSGGRPFILNARTAQVAPAVSLGDSAGMPPYSQVAYNDDSSIKAAYGIWIEAVQSNAVVVRRFVDFHIRACWPAPGSSIPMTIGTIVRLYDPS